MLTDETTDQREVNPTGSACALRVIDPRKSLCYKAEPVGFTSRWSVVSSVNWKVFEDDVLLG